MGIAGSKINAESGRSYITQDRPPIQLLERLELPRHYDRSVLREPTLQADEKNDLMLDAVHGYLLCLKGMHDKNLKHGDIDLKNFFHDADSPRVAIGDFR